MSTLLLLIPVLVNRVAVQSELMLELEAHTHYRKNKVTLTQKPSMQNHKTMQDKYINQGFHQTMKIALEVVLTLEQIGNMPTHSIQFS